MNLFSTTLIAQVLLLCCLTGCSNGNANNGGNDHETTDPTTLPVKGYLTTADRTQLLKKVSLDYLASAPASQSQTVVLDKNTTYQTVDGFGAALTGSACYNLMQMSDENRTAFLKKCFSTSEGYGFGMIRISIGASDFALDEYTCCDQEGIEFFDLNFYDRRDVLPVLKQILTINPDVKIIASPWSCPKWMKIGVNDTKPFDSWTSGRLNPKYYGDYAEYFVKWIFAMREAGVPIYAITVQNEPLNHGNSMSLYMPWTEQRDFIKSSLGPALREAGLDVKILIFDHNYNYDNNISQSNYPLRIFDDADAAQYIDGSAWHSYGGNVSELDNIHSARPDKSIYFTEASIGTWNYNFANCLITDFEQIFIGTLLRWGKGVTLWNLMLDSQRGPNRPGGCTTCFGAVDIARDYTTITYNSHFYNIAHCSSVIAQGAVRIEASGYKPSGVSYAAFLNPDGTYAFVAVNSSAADQDIVVSDRNHLFKCRLAAKSLASYVWCGK